MLEGLPAHIQPQSHIPAGQALVEQDDRPGLNTVLLILIRDLHARESNTVLAPQPLLCECKPRFVGCNTQRQ